MSELEVNTNLALLEEKLKEWETEASILYGKSMSKEWVDRVHSLSAQIREMQSVIEQKDKKLLIIKHMFPYAENKIQMIANWGAMKMAADDGLDIEPKVLL